MLRKYNIQTIYIQYTYCTQTIHTLTSHAHTLDCKLTCTWQSLPQSINKDGKKHIRKPIDLSVLDDIGHGVVVQEEPRPVPLHQSQNINSIVGRDKPGPQREKSRGHPFSSSLKQNGAGPPRGGELQEYDSITMRMRLVFCGTLSCS